MYVFIDTNQDYNKKKNEKNNRIFILSQSDYPHVIFFIAFQFCYTTIFGWYVSFAFLRLGSIWPPILCHSFCNIMGFPDVSDIQLQPPIKRTGKHNLIL